MPFIEPVHISNRRGDYFELDAVYAAKEGDTFESHVGPERVKQEFTVGPSCGRNDGSGRWMCITHDEVFANQLAKDSHISKGEHMLVWICPEHGPEQP